MSSELPVVFLAFANDRDAHLDALKVESRNTFRTLQPLVQRELIEVHREESSGSEELYQDLLSFRGRVVLFHYAGHADGSALHLEDDGGSASGIASLLGMQSGLRLVFLNGCATLEQVKGLHAAGVPAVIATSVKINDERATRFSQAFYEALAAGNSLFEAFELACAFLETRAGDGLAPRMNRYPKFEFEEEEDAQGDEFEWGLYVQEAHRAELAQWRLTEAREAWQVPLADARGPLLDTAGTPLVVHYRQARGLLQVFRCAKCNTASACSATEAPTACLLCGSDQGETRQELVPLAQEETPSGIGADQAEQLLSQAVPGATIRALDLLRLPCWVFDGAARYTVSGRRGRIVEADGGNKLELDEASCEIERKISGISIAAATPGEVVNWPATIGEAIEAAPPAPASPVLVGQKELAPAFVELSARLDSDVEVEALEQLGGTAPRVDSLDARYTGLTASSRWLPVWRAVLERNDQRHLLLISAADGAIRSPRVAGFTHLPVETGMDDNNPGPTRRDLWISVFSGAGIGIMVGLLMGLAAPQDEGARSVVSVFIGAVGVGLAALLGLNDRYFSISKGLRIGSFGLAVAISALSGIYIRDHGVISPTLKERVDAVVKAGDISPREALDRLIGYDAQGTQGKEGAAANVSKNLRAAMSSYQFSEGVDRDACQRLQETGYEASFTGQEMVDKFIKEGGEGWARYAKEVDKRIAPDQQRDFLALSRDIACGKRDFLHWEAPPPESCATLQAAVTDGRADAIARASKQPEFALVTSSLDSKLKDPEQTLLGLSLLTPILCDTKEETL